MGPVAAVVATEALQVKELTLLVADNTTGYFGVYLSQPGRPKPYKARVWRGGKSFLDMNSTPSSLLPKR